LWLSIQIQINWENFYRDHANRAGSYVRMWSYLLMSKYGLPLNKIVSNEYWVK
jgi:hypothetical protein